MEYAPEKKSSIFKENYEKYMQQIKSLDFEDLSRRLGLKKEKDCLFVPLFNKLIKVNKTGIYDESNNVPMYSICIVIAKYLLLAPKILPPQKSWVTYRDFKDSAPFATAFSNNVEKMIVKRFSNKLDQLKKAGEKLGGLVVDDMELSYELIMKFGVLPNFSVLLVFNDCDEEFPAEAKILFPDNGDKILDMECLAICGWLLSDYLHIMNGGCGFTIM